MPRQEQHESGWREPYEYDDGPDSHIAEATLPLQGVHGGPHITAQEGEGGEPETEERYTTPGEGYSIRELGATASGTAIVEVYEDGQGVEQHQAAEAVPFGHQLARLREESGRRVADISKAQHISTATIYRIFHGQTYPPVKTIAGLLGELGVPPEQATALLRTYESERKRAMGLEDSPALPAIEDSASAAEVPPQGAYQGPRHVLLKLHALLEERGIDIASLLPPNATGLKDALPLLLDSDLSTEEIAAQFGLSAQGVSRMRSRAVKLVLRRTPPEIAALVGPPTERGRRANETTDTVGRRLRSLFDAIGTPHAQIAQKAGTSPNALSRFFTGQNYREPDKILLPLLGVLVDAGRLTADQVEQYVALYQQERAAVIDAREKAAAENVRPRLTPAEREERDAVILLEDQTPGASAELGPRIRTLLAERRVRVKDIAEQLEMSQNELVDFLTGISRPSKRIVFAILGMAGVKLQTINSALDRYRSEPSVRPPRQDITREPQPPSSRTDTPVPNSVSEALSRIDRLLSMNGLRIATVIPRQEFTDTLKLAAPFLVDPALSDEAIADIARIPPTRVPRLRAHLLRLVMQHLPATVAAQAPNVEGL